MALIDIFLVSPSTAELVVRWDDVNHAIRVYEVGKFEELGDGPMLDYAPDPNDIYMAMETDGDYVFFRQLQYFPYAEQVVYPPDGEFIRNDCNGVHLQQRVADGRGGERWGEVVEYNSATCGYTPPEPEPEPEPEPVVLGCTDPTAENYNPLATQDDGTCAYAARVFTEVKTVEVLPCADGVTLRWFNTLGGIDTWLFSGKVDRPFASEASGEFSHESGLLGAASKAGQPSMVLRAANLNYNRYQALWQLYTSPKVWIHHADGTAEEVYVQPSNLPAMPIGRNSYDITVELVKAPINTLKK